MFDDEEEKPKKKKSGSSITSFFSLVIAPAADWQDAEIIATMEDICEIFNKAYPGQYYSYEEMTLALHEMRIPRERNEHNNEFYYLAKWK